MLTSYEGGHQQFPVAHGIVDEFVEKYKARHPDPTYKPMFTDYSTHFGQYDAIISSAVLNVVAQDQRDALVVKMGQLLKKGGKMYVTTRTTKGDVDNLAKNPNNVPLGPHEFVETVHNHYQKGFTNPELKAYLQDALGDEFVVEIATGKNKFNNNTAVIVTKVGKSDNGQTQMQTWDEEKFGNEVQAWYDSNTPEERIKSGGYFIVGATSDLMKSIGVKDGKISWEQSKVEKILRDHAKEGIDIDIIKQVPGIIENPVVVLKSKTVEGSLVLFGELKTKTGRQVMASISLVPARGGGMDAEISVITGAYTRRKNNIRNLLKSSYVLFVDDTENNERANSWLRPLGLQLPSGQPIIGSVGSITYTDNGVNIEGKIDRVK
ncbi:MAG: hypothetical protein K6C08_07715, partial [Oscillospiraceae bacterium]|nr:hypothetical protein [Oscillospiraceae bacterium]